MTKTPLLISLFIMGISLLILNIVGVFISLRNSEIYQEHTYFENDITLTEKELWSIINKEYGSNEERIIAINSAINKGIAHYWGEEVKKYNLSIPMHENYLLFMAAYTYSFLTKYVPPFRKFFKKFRESFDILRKYEFSDYKKAIERGVGTCSQHTIIINQVLKKKGIDSKIVYLNGHVVAMAQVNNTENTWWVIDPDYGVIMKHDIHEIEQRPDMIAPYYREKGHSEGEIKELIAAFSEEENKIYNTVSDYHGKERFYKYHIEYVFYILKWMLPMVLLTPYCLFLIKNRRKDCCL